MRRQRIIRVVAITAVLAIWAGAAQAKTVVLHSSFSRGHIVGRPLGPGVHVGPVARSYVFAKPFHTGIVISSPLRSRIAPIFPHREVLVVSQPCVQPLIVEAAPTCVVTSRTVVVEPSIITVWVRNSNGSQSPVKLTRSGPGYIGPRGEYYPDMPNNEQLRMVYGF